MRLEFCESDDVRALGAIVITKNAGDITIDAGPADGPPHVRITISRAEALHLSANLRAVANGRDEEVLLSEE